MTAPVFVFGSNLAGRHGGGAALYAARHHGAKDGVGFGPTGNAWAIPTKDQHLKTLPLADIKRYVDAFITEANDNRPRVQYIITAIGTGLAGYRHDSIGPLFAYTPSNCIMPIQWKEFMDGSNYTYHDEGKILPKLSPVRNLLDVPIISNDANATTLRDYFQKLLTKLIQENEGFSGKRPFGNSGWMQELATILFELKSLPSASFVDSGDSYEIENYDDNELERVLIELIEQL